MCEKKIKDENQGRQRFTDIDNRRYCTQEQYLILNDYGLLVDDLTFLLTLKVLVTTTDAQWEGMGDVGSARYEPALLPPCPTERVLSYSN